MVHVGHDASLVHHERHVGAVLKEGAVAGFRSGQRPRALGHRVLEIRHGFAHGESVELLHLRVGFDALLERGDDFPRGGELGLEGANLVVRIRHRVLR